MKKIILIVIAIIAVQFAHAQSWNLTLNSISGNPNFGTSNNHPINFFTNGTQRMVLTTTGDLKINRLAGTGNRFLQVDANGILLEWTGTSGNGDKILFGDNSWRTFPFDIDGNDIGTATGTKLGIGVANPTSALDVSGDVTTTGTIKAPGGFMFTSADGITYNPTDNYFVLGKGLSGGNPAVNSCFSLPTAAQWLYLGQGGYVSSQHSPTVAPLVNANMRMFISPNNGSGYIEVDGKDQNNTNNNALYLNYNCGRNTYINTGSSPGHVYIGTTNSASKVYLGNHLSTGDFVSMTKHLEIGSSTTGIVNSPNNIALDMHVNDGKGLRLKTTIEALDALIIQNEDPNTSAPLNTFRVTGDGRTEIISSNVLGEAFIIKNAINPGHDIAFKVESQGYAEIIPQGVDALGIAVTAGGQKTFNIGANGTTYIGGNVGIGILPSTGTFLRVNAGTNSSNANLFTLGSSNTPDAMKIDSKGIIAIDGTGPASGYVFRIKRQGNDLFAITHNGIAYAREVVVTLSAFPDYVFSSDYKLRSLSEVKAYVELHSKLPNMPSAKEVAVEGASLGEIQRLTVEKVEELYLYIFQLEEKIQALNDQLKKVIQK